jgi:hypothetical protein
MGTPTKPAKAKRGDDTMTFGGRIRLAMVQRGVDSSEKAVPHLQKRWKDHFKNKGVKTPDRQVFYQWLAADRPRIYPENLFHLSDCLDVSTRWLALNEGPPTKPVFPDLELKKLLDAWGAMKTPAAREALLREAAHILAIQGESSPAHPFRTKIS